MQDNCSEVVGGCALAAAPPLIQPLLPLAGSPGQMRSWARRLALTAAVHELDQSLICPAALAAEEGAMEGETGDALLEPGEVAEPALQALLHQTPQPTQPQQQQQRPQAAVSAQARVVARFLLSNAAAGSVIGKAGTTISEFQDQSSARIQLSKHGDFFPGTTDRVMYVSGPVNQVLTALHLIVTKVRAEHTVADSLLTRDGKAVQLRLLVHSQLCGSILGRGGATIKGFSEDSRAQITVSPQDRVPRGATDRVVRIAGELEQIMRAVALILSRLAENPNYAKLTSISVSSLPSSMCAAASGGSGGRGSREPSANGAPAAGVASVDSNGSPTSSGAHSPPAGVPPSPLQPPGAPHLLASPADRAELVMLVPDCKVGAIIGKGGQVITGLKSYIGVEIRISDKSDLIPGTSNRRVTISGPAELAHIAQTLIQRRVNQQPE